MVRQLAFLFLFLFFSAPVFAQHLRLAPLAGLNIAKYNKKIDGESVSNASVTGVHIGLMGEMPIGKSFYLMPGLLYSRRGAKWSFDENAAVVNVTESLSYIELPLNVAYRMGAGKSLFVYAGPYVAYAIDGRITYELGPLTDNKDVEFGNEQGMYKRLDLGFSIGAGYELPMRLFVKAQYGQGLANMLGGGDSDNLIRHQVISFSLGYFLR